MTDEIFKEEMLRDDELDNVAGGTTTANFIAETVNSSWRPPGVKNEFIPPQSKLTFRGLPDFGRDFFYMSSSLGANASRKPSPIKLKPSINVARTKIGGKI